VAPGEQATADPARGPRPDVLIVANGNPLSRDAATTGRALSEQLRTATGVDPDIITTESAGQARLVAEQWALEHPDGVIVGVGGDGTLNEVANGILAASATHDACTVLAVYPGGNANDQVRSWTPAERSSIDAASLHAAVPVDVLELSWQTADRCETGRRYALSHVAIGLLATAASILNGRRRGPLTNILVVLLTLRRLRPLRVVIDGAESTVDSLSWHIVAQTAKYLRVSKRARRDDGLMEVLVVRHRRGPTWLRILSLAARALIGLGTQMQRTSMSIHWEEGGIVQLDGETVDIPPGSDVTVRCRPGAIRMLCLRRTGPPV
jgi:diacylglycerol kinase family enzyme